MKDQEEKEQETVENETVKSQQLFEEHINLQEQYQDAERKHNEQMVQQSDIKADIEEMETKIGSTHQTKEENEVDLKQNQEDIDRTKKMAKDTSEKIE